ncbi:ribbon-helix-helix protein, CopG family [Rhodovibrio sodomensis]|uniref:ribbon-helix-helix protein, CopG family n=1 Tax=Rhodovibrio sodomensis TaxID=1088 RepID=UPI00190763AE|nr:ribbon-helix-helix protein, CopG family [Rhodovibrio sodomensis]
MTQKRDQRIPIHMTTEEVERLDEWRRQQPDLPSRAEAIRRLIERGLYDLGR